MDANIAVFRSFLFRQDWFDSVRFLEWREMEPTFQSETQDDDPSKLKGKIFETGGCLDLESSEI